MLFTVSLLKENFILLFIIPAKVSHFAVIKDGQSYRCRFVSQASDFYNPFRRKFSELARIGTAYVEEK